MNVKDMDKEEAIRRLAENVERINKLLADCKELSDEHNIPFTYNYDSWEDTELEKGWAEDRWYNSNC